MEKQYLLLLLVLLAFIVHPQEYPDNQMNGPGNVVISGTGNVANGENNVFDGNSNQADGD